MNETIAFVDLVARITLATVFVVAAAAKLRDRARARQAVADFGLPTPLVGPIAMLLPYSEIILSLGLIPGGTAAWAAAGMFLMLTGFSMGMVVNLMQGHKPACHCFGEIDSEPIGWHSLLRNAILGVIALMTIVSTLLGAYPEVMDTLVIASRATGLTVTGVVVAAAGLLASLAEGYSILRLRKQNQQLALRIRALESRPGLQETTTEPAAIPLVGLPIGVAAPSFRLNDIAGKTISLDGLRVPGKPILLVFTDPNCGPCQRLMPDVGLWEADYADELTITLVSRGTSAENLTKFSEYGLRHVALQQDREVQESYRIRGTPSAVIVRPDGTIGSKTAEGAEDIVILATQALTHAMQAMSGKAAAGTYSRLTINAQS